MHIQAVAKASEKSGTTIDDRRERVDAFVPVVGRLVKQEWFEPVLWSGPRSMYGHGRGGRDRGSFRDPRPCVFWPAVHFTARDLRLASQALRLPFS